MTNLIERAAALHMGTVESVAPDSISVRLDIDAPQTTALNTGVPSPFPRLNGYVLVPKESGALVGLVVWLGIDRSPLPKMRGGAERASASLIDLPFPQRRMIVAPVGTLLVNRDSDEFQMERGVTAFPSVGDEVLLPTRRQLRAIIEPTGKDTRLHLGEAVLAAGARVGVDPDKLFGRHVAVLGNTGSGKSCTVAGLVRWSLEAAAAANQGATPNARFIVLDPNGEYGPGTKGERGGAFDGLPGGVRYFRAPPVSGDFRELLVPAWVWNGHEWSAFATASARVQRPLLVQALRDVRSGGHLPAPGARALARLAIRMRQTRDWLRVQVGRGPVAQQGTGDRKTIGDRLVRFADDMQSAAAQLSDPIHQQWTSYVSQVARGVALARASKGTGVIWYDTFSDAEIESVNVAIDRALVVLPAPPPLGMESEDAPIPFDPRELVERVEVLSQDERAGNAAGFIATLVLRMQTMLADHRMRPIIAPDGNLTFEEWLCDIIGADGASNGTVAVVDLSLVPSDVVHVIVAVLARVIFEATQRYRRLNAKELPTVLVLEEAHTFVRRHDQDDGDSPSAAQMCRQTFERIAREGRKFGLGLVLSSQRPAELSPTVLAQCNTFILHRLVNDRDQDIVQRLVPDNLAGLLKELPTLPTRHAIVLGWATALPVLTRIRELPDAQRPNSSDPAFWDTWVHREARPIDWQRLAASWTGMDDEGANPVASSEPAPSESKDCDDDEYDENDERDRDEDEYDGPPDPAWEDD